jgi:uracil-DNA glycosylase
VSYEPRQFGARCDQCPLNGCSVVVPPETRSTATVAVIGDYPGLDDMRNERPFTGAVGGEFDQAIEQAGLTRRDLHITNALLCRPPDGRLENVVAKVQKENRKIVRENAQRAKNGEAQLPMKLFPVDCCRPRLMAEIRGFEKMLLVGGVAVRSALGLGASISAAA